jgi:hypothetical protein
MKDIQLRGIILAKYYERRRGTFFLPNEADFNNLISIDNILAISDQLGQHRLIEWKSIKALGGMVTGMGKISAYGIAFVEGEATPDIKVEFVQNKSITITGSSNVIVGNQNHVTINQHISELANAIEKSSGTTEQKEEAKGFLRQFIEHPLVSAIAGGAIDLIKWGLYLKFKCNINEIQVMLSYATFHFAPEPYCGREPNSPGVNLLNLAFAPQPNIALQLRCWYPARRSGAAELGIRRQMRDARSLGPPKQPRPESASHGDYPSCMIVLDRSKDSEYICRTDDRCQVTVGELTTHCVARLRQFTRGVSMRTNFDLIRVAVALATVLAGSASSATVVTFGGLGGTNGASYTTYAESGYTVTKTAGTGCVGQFFGNPTPDIFGGPSCDGGTTGTFSLTGGTFKFDAIDLAANNGTLTYTFVGKLGANTLWSQSGTLTGPTAVFATISGTNLGSVVDSVTLSFATAGSSFNLDNINVISAPVPEPTSLAMAGVSLATLVLWMRRRK